MRLSKQLPIRPDSGVACTGQNGSRGFCRYDVRLLLDTLPAAEPPSAFEGGRLSPTGWSDLPSDTEDTFFFSPDEVEDFHREKRRRMMDQNREERLRALRAELGEDGDIAPEQDAWGGSDEEVSDTCVYASNAQALM